jgi:hypothetical protein
MRNFRLSRYLLRLTVLLACTAGCQVMYRYRPLPILVRDAETKKPLADAELHLSYPLSRDSMAPFDSSERTGADGIAHLRAAPYGDFGVRLEASAAGYMTEQQTLSTELIQDLKPPHPFEATEHRPPASVVEMYAEPRFTVELVVPASYHGLIKTDIQFDDDLPVPAGQRCFRYEVTDGFVAIKAPGVLRRICPPDFHARYADGTALTNEMSLLKVGFRWLRGEGKEHYFFVGTQPEYDMQRRSTPADVMKKLWNDPSSNKGGRRRRPEY